LKLDVPHSANEERGRKRCKEARSLHFKYDEGMEIEESEDKLNGSSQMKAKEEKKERVNDQKIIRREEGKN
jgi:hypothetical protein